MDNVLKLIPLKNILASDRKYTQLVALIVEQLEDFKDHKYKCNPELALHIITIIENVILKKDRIDKLQLAIDVFIKLFDIQDGEEVKTFSVCIHFLLDHKSAKKIKTTKYIGAFVKSFF
jgi:hypothetical protein